MSVLSTMVRPAGSDPGEGIELKIVPSMVTRYNESSCESENQRAEPSQVRPET